MVGGYCFLPKELTDVVSEHFRTGTQINKTIPGIYDKVICLFKKNKPVIMRCDTYDNETNADLYATGYASLGAVRGTKVCQVKIALPAGVEVEIYINEDNVIF